MGTELEHARILQGDLREIMPLILKMVGNSPGKNDWDSITSKSVSTDVGGPSFHPVAVLRLLRARFPQHTIFVTDTGQHQIFAANYLPISKPSTFITSGGLGCMGFGFPASLGAKVAHPDLPVVNIAGDGSFLMVCQELATSVSNNIPVTVCIFNNGYLGMIRQSQLSCFNQLSQVDLSPSPNFAQLAESFGASGIRIENLNDIMDLDISPENTTVVDIPIDPTVSVPSNSYSWNTSTRG